MATPVLQCPAVGLWFLEHQPIEVQAIVDIALEEVQATPAVEPIEVPVAAQAEVHTGAPVVREA